MRKSNYNKNDIISSLKNIGLKNGDSVFCHSNLGFFGILENASTKEDYCKSFLDAIFTVIGNNGTLVVPTFTYSYCWGKIYDIVNSKSTCGIFTEFIRSDPRSFRSNDGNFSVCAIGKNAEYFTTNCPPNPFGKDSFWERFLLKNGVISNLNFDAAATLTHYIEREMNVSYRSDKAFEGKSMINGKIQNNTFYHFVRDDNNPEVYPDFTKFDKKAKQLGLAKVTNLGRGQIVCISTKDYVELMKNEMSVNPNFMIKGKVEH